MITYILIAAGASAAGALLTWLLMRSRQSATKALLNQALEQAEKTESAQAVQTAELRRLSTELATAEADKRNLQNKIDEQTAQTEQLQKRLTTEFENIANRVMQQRQEELNQQNRKQIGDILQPLNEKIKDFREQVSTAFSNETREKASLQAELKQLMELNRTLSRDADNLTKALKGDVKKQGNWGELILERVLEASGLRKGVEYQTQESFYSLEGQRQQPDVVIFMPDNKQIIVDSKVSLVAYEQLQQAESEEQYKQLLKQHTESVRQHVKELYEKQYQRATGLNTPDFVLMFMPIEASYAVALQADGSLYDYALERKIVIVSPTTLLATLHTVSYVWRQENQNRNAQEIARLAGAMYDKLCGAMEDFQKIQKSLDAAQKACNESVKKLSEGNGNVLRTAERIKELGAKAGKQLPAELTQ
ncbi:MAG: DNA recombination protein RmuC [Paludibacteraceae bacterium]|nr:DNA recombination protein RmuC [Paludibacteraceae bacterium]